MSGIAYEPLTTDELLFSLQKLVEEFGASNAADTASDSLANLSYRELTAQQSTRVKQRRKTCCLKEPGR